MKTINRIYLVACLLLASLALLPAQGRAQSRGPFTTDVTLSLEYFLYDLEADCTGSSFTVPEQYVVWSMVQGTTVVSDPTPTLRPSRVATIDDPRRPRQSCGLATIDSALHAWQPLEDIELTGTFDSRGGPITVTIEMFDRDGSGPFNDDDRLDLTRLDESTVTFTVDPEALTYNVTDLRDQFCNNPDPACTDNEGQWCGACNDAQACCNTNVPNLLRGYAFRGDGHGAGLSWSIGLTRYECTARRDVDTDRDTLLDDWETHGYDHGCNGSIDLPFHTWGANPMHRDVFIEYDACDNLRISKQGIRNLKAAFANAPLDATGFPNPDGRPGINVHVDTGQMLDLFAHEGVNTCNDGRNNDGDPRVDMADPSCALGYEEAAGPCNDRIDNDGDGTIDMGGTCSGLDANRAEVLKIEGTRGNCADGFDSSDEDTLIDAFDPDCRAGDNLGGGSRVTCVPWGIPVINETFLSIKAGNFSAARHGKFRYALRWPKSGDQSFEHTVRGGCSNGIDDERNGLTDKDDPACQLAREDGLVGFGVGDCQDSLDNDGDGNGDAFDPECLLVPEVPSTGQFSCYDRLDNGDGLIDRKDPDCMSWGGYNDGNDNIAIFADDDSGALLMHELGHSMGLAHGGPLSVGAQSQINFKSNHLSVMNYLYGFGVPQDPDAMAENVTMLRESLGASGHCGDRIDNDGDGFIDALDPECRGSCSDLADNDFDRGVNQLDPECRGIDMEGDGIGDHLLLDFSPPAMHIDTARSNVSISMLENALQERQAFGVDIDWNRDGLQDVWGDALNLVRFRRYAPNLIEGAGAGAMTCSDGADNDGNLASDYFDTRNCTVPRVLGSADRFATYLTAPRTGERMPVAGGLTRLPVGIDLNNDNDANDFVELDMDEDEDPSNDRDDALRLLESFDDWRGLRMGMTVNNSTPSGALYDREPSGPELVELTRLSRPADLVLDSSSARLVPGANGAATLSVEVENIEPSPAYGPVTLTLGGLPIGTTVTASGGQCWAQNGETVCARSQMRGYEVWTLTFSMQNDLCAWNSSTLNLSVQHAGGFELNPEDNTLAIEVGGSGIWSQWRQCPSHWGASNHPGPSTLGTPTTVWSGAEILNTPVIDAAGDIYLADAGGYVRKLAPNGTSRWVSGSIGVVHAGPALTPAGHIVVATADGRIRGLSQATGAEVWSYQTGSNVYASIVVAGDRLYATTELGLGFADQLLAFNIDGTFLWTRDLGGPITSAPTVGVDGTIYVAVETAYFVPGKLVAVNPNNTERWSRNLDGHVRYSPVQRNGKVYVGTSTRRVYAFNASTGVQSWMYTVPCGAFEACEVSGTPAALANNQLAVGVGGGRVHVIRDNGTSVTLLRSIPPTGILLGGPRDAIVVGSNGIAYVGNQNAQLRALNLATGAQVSLATLNGNAVGSVALDGQGRLYVGTDAGRLYRY